MLPHRKIIRSFDHETPLTSVTFSLDGATLYMGTENGRLLVQSLRAATEPAKTITISESGYPVLGLAVSVRAKYIAFCILIYGYLCRTEKAVFKRLQTRHSRRCSRICICSSPQSTTQASRTKGYKQSCSCSATRNISGQITGWFREHFPRSLQSSDESDFYRGITLPECRQQYR